MKMKLKTGDKVLVISGKDRGKSGKILRVLTKESRVVVEKVNMRTKHVKKTRAKAGEIIRYEGPVHISNVMYMTEEGPSRIGSKTLENGEKVRIAKRTKDVLETIKVVAKSKK